MLKIRLLFGLLFSLCFLGVISASQSPEYVISANDCWWQLEDSKNAPLDSPGVGNVTMLDMSVMPPKQINIDNVPCSVTGPPTCLAITPDNTIILVAAAMKLDEETKQQTPDNRVSVIDAAARKVIDTLIVGSQPSGISISPDGKTAMVCNRADGTVTNLRISGRKVTIDSTVKICEPQESLSHIIFAPDGSFAAATLNKTSSIIKISLNDGIAGDPLERIEVGKGPYCMDITPDGKWIAVANVAEATVSIVDASNPDKLHLSDTIFAGVTPEGLDISPDGKWLAVSCLQYSMVSPDDSKRQQYGQVVLLRRKPEYFSIIQRLQVDRIPQGVAFSPDSKYLVVGGFENQRLKIYELCNERLDFTGIVVDVHSQPCSLRAGN
jgi:YVTN family beta-propeller protein